MFVGQLDGQLVALDRATGRLAWSIQAERWQDNFSITAAPLYVDGMVIIGFAGGDRGTRGRIKAYDATDGRLIWTFYTIPGPGEPGHETWPQDNDAWKYGGAAIWQTPAVDPELGLVYFSTGNAAPDYNGAFRAGDNLYAVSILAIELATGKYRWHFQQVHHDIWDYDAVNPVVLLDVRDRRPPAQGARGGGQDRLGVHPRSRDRQAAHRHRREAGAAGAAAEDRGHAAVSARRRHRAAVHRDRARGPRAGQRRPHLHAVRRHRCRRSWHPASGAARAGRRARTIRYSSACSSAPRPWSTATPAAGTRRSSRPATAAPLPGGAVDVHARRRAPGIIAALDVTTNKLAWRYQWPEQCYSGTLATAGGLLFVGRNDGRLTALDSATGKQLWEFQTGAGMHAPVSTFEHRGKQYVLAYLGRQRAARLGARRQCVAVRARRERSAPRAAGRARVATAAAPPAGHARPLAATVGASTDANLAEGQRLFKQTCAVCHGDDGKGGHTGGAPLDRVTDFDAAIRTVTDGRDNMPPFRAASRRNRFAT